MNESKHQNGPMAVIIKVLAAAARITCGGVTRCTVAFQGWRSRFRSCSNGSSCRATSFVFFVGEAR